MERTRATMDGSHAAAYVAYAYTDVAAIYPITPSSVMAEVTEAWAAEGRENLFGNPVEISQMQSEAGAAAAVHGALAAGALAATFTASQGLLLMIPNLYKIAGERLPGVFHVAARSIATHALSIFGDHSDIYACRQTGAAMLCASSVQEVMDLSPAAHGAAIEGRIPFINFFDGFRTSHEIQKISVWSESDLRDLFPMESVKKFRENALNPEHPFEWGQAQNPDIFFQIREAANRHYAGIPELVQSYFDKINQKIGTDYRLFQYYGAPDASHVIIAMGSVCGTIEEAVDFLLEQGGRAGLVKVRLYRPFSAGALLSCLPDTAGQITVLDRTKEPGAPGEPLYLDVAAALKGTKFEHARLFHGRYGIGSKDTTPGQILAVYANRSKSEFTIGIRDDVTHLSLEEMEFPAPGAEHIFGCKFWGLGADGTVGANKNSIQIIGDHTDLYVQAYFDYDSKKSGGLTVSHLRFGKRPIRSSYLVQKADFVACHNPSYVWKYNMVQDLVPGGTFLLNCPWEPKDAGHHLPGRLKRALAEKNIRFYVINGTKIGMETGMGPTRINTILQAAFFKLTNILPEAQIAQLLKDAAKKTYGKKGDSVVAQNCAAIDAGMQGAKQAEVKAEWAFCGDDPLPVREIADKRQDVSDYVNRIQRYVNAFEGSRLPVSDFLDYADGAVPSGTAAYEKRNIAVRVPNWIPEHCIECCICSYVCPHAVIRPVAMDKEESMRAPEGMADKEMPKHEAYRFAITVSVSDCTGCGVCAACCPARTKALVMEPAEKHGWKQTYFDFGRTLREKEELVEQFGLASVKGSQFRQPLLEFHGACAGCGETAYAKLVTQLFGDRMYIANATGCSSIWGNSSPATPYTVNQKGMGPAWSNSLFEDAAEFGYGMLLCEEAIRAGLKKKIEKMAVMAKSQAVKEAAEKWLSTYHCGKENQSASEELVGKLLECSCARSEEILGQKQFLSKKSTWIFGGDGWAYDIGFGGLDHVLASGRDINILVFDTEVYSNTGGQVSKATPLGAVAQFAAGGKGVPKKDLALMAMSYGTVFVAQIAMGADYGQCVRAITEAEAYPGPSLILAYSPCINQGIRSGMHMAQEEEKRAVLAGYYHLFRFQPAAGKRERPSFFLDSKEPKGDFDEFLNGEVRFGALSRSNPVRAKELFERAKQDAMEKYERLKKIEKMLA